MSVINVALACGFQPLVLFQMLSGALPDHALSRTRIAGRKGRLSALRVGGGSAAAQRGGLARKSVPRVSERNQIAPSGPCATSRTRWVASDESFSASLRGSPESLEI